MTAVTAYELQFARESAGSAIDPEGARIVKSSAAWADNSGVFVQTLERGIIPHPATGSNVLTRRIAGLSRTTVGSPLTVEGTATGAYAFVNGVVATNNSLPLINKGGYNGYYVGSGRAAGPDFLKADGNLETALKNSSTMTTGTFDCYQGSGASDSLGATTQDNTEVMGAWQSHFGVIEFTDNTNVNTLQDTICNDIKSRGAFHLLPDSYRVNDCAYSGVGPDGTIYMSTADYGVNFPSDVTLNTSDKFKNHPTVFVRVKGAQNLRTVVKRWQDSVDIATSNAGQPIGIVLYNAAVTLSKWLLRIDGVANVYWIKSPDGSDYRRPRDLWNNVIVPLISTKGSDKQRVTVYDRTGVAIGTDERWQYLEIARYLGDFGTEQQSNTAPLG